MSLIGKIIYVLSPHKWGREEDQKVLGSGQETAQPQQLEVKQPTLEQVDHQRFYTFASGCIAYMPPPIMDGRVTVISGSMPVLYYSIIGSGQIRATYYNNGP